MNGTECYRKFPNFDNNYCPTVFDNYLCWKSTPPGTNVSLNCPELEWTLTDKLAHRRCMENGTWDSNGKKDNDTLGYTYYDECFPTQLRKLLELCSKVSCDVAKHVRVLEIVGYTLSLASILVSLCIFYRLSVLKNNRTKIHSNLFLATLYFIPIKLVIYLDQYYIFNKKVPYLFEICTVLSEYTKTAMFMWMFIEGLYLHNMITVTVFQEYSYIKIYFYIGWVVPAVITASWMCTMLVVVKYKVYWKNYFLLPYYWILEGPRNTIIIVNLLFLLNIIRVLVIKLRESHTSEMEQLRKAVRAAVFLLPLLGFPHILFMFFHYEFNKWEFDLWMYSSYFFSSFQGFLVAVLYCFLNGEVQSALKNRIYLHMSLRNHDYTPCRNLTLVSTATEPEVKLTTSGNSNWIQKCFKKYPSKSEENNLTTNVKPWNGLQKEDTRTSIMDDTKPEVMV